jgi:uncharacterized protein (DUF1778 family)/ribosomal protein S18 acetylase RimI-like enzyme
MAQATGRLEIRLHPDEKTRLERAAKVRGIPASRFARDAIRVGVDATLSGHDSLTRLDRAEFDRWRDRLAAPVEPADLPDQLAQLARVKRVQTELLDPSRHRVEAFDSGTWTGSSAIDRTPGPVDTWLFDHAHVLTEAQQAKLPRPGREPCFVLSTNKWDEIEGFYTVRPHRVVWGDPPFEDGDELSALMIGRLTIASYFQREGRGRLLLVDALHRLLATSEIDGAVLIVASAPTELGRTFYEKHGFTPVGRDHLALPIHDARAAMVS